MAVASKVSIKATPQQTFSALTNHDSQHAVVLQNKSQGARSGCKQDAMIQNLDPRCHDTKTDYHEVRT